MTLRTDLTDATASSPLHAQQHNEANQAILDLQASPGGVTSVDGRTGTVTLSDLYQNLSGKGAASGYASLDGSTLVPTAQLGTGTANSTTFLRGDRTWQTVATGPDTPWSVNHDAGAYSLTNLGVASAAAGSASAPAFTFDADTNTGVYRSAADVLGLAAGGVAATLGIATFAGTSNRGMFTADSLFVSGGGTISGVSNPFWSDITVNQTTVFDGATVATGTYNLLNASPVIRLNNSATLANVWGLKFNPNINKNSGTAGTATTVYGVDINPQVALVNVGTLYGLRVAPYNFSVSLATITNFTALLIDKGNTFSSWSGTTTATALSIPATFAADGAATNTWAIAVGALYSYHEGYFRVGATAAGSNTVPNAQLEVVQPTIGSEVQRLTSVATNDDPAEQVFQARVATTDATTTTLWSFGSLASSTVYFVEAWVVARRTGGAAGAANDGAGYVLRAVYKSASGTPVLIGSAQQSFTAESQAGWDAALTLYGTAILVTVTGAANNNVTWHATVRVWKVST